MKWFFRRFFKTHALFYCFAIISLVKRVLPFISTIKVLLSIRMFCTKFGYIWPSGSRKEVKNMKSLHTDRQTDGRRTTLESLVQVSFKPMGNKMVIFKNKALFFKQMAWQIDRWTSCLQCTPIFAMKVSGALNLLFKHHVQHAIWAVGFQ